jgi:hypothetical protein
MQQGKATKNKTPANALDDAMMVTEPDVGEDRKSPRYTCKCIATAGILINFTWCLMFSLSPRMHWRIHRFNTGGSPCCMYALPVTVRQPQT